MSKNYHKEAVAAMQFMTEQDSVQILLLIAESNPSAIVKANRRYRESVKLRQQKQSWPSHLKPYTPSPDVLNKAKSHETYIAAIKAVRAETGYGLKEAKDIVDHLRANA